MIEVVSKRCIEPFSWDMISTKWYIKDTENLHRLDGPAIEWDDGDMAWFLFGVRHSFKSYCEAHPNAEQAALLKLTY